MRFMVLGPVEVWDGDRQLVVGGTQQRALLAALLLNADRVVSSDRLVEYLWGEDPPATARDLLYGCIAALRRVLRAGGASAAGQALLTRAPGYVLRLGSGELDLQRFEALAREAGRAVDRGSAADLELAAGSFADALSLWRGPALDDIDLERFQGDVARLEERRLAVLEQRIEVDLRLGRLAGLVGELQVQVQAHPLRERLWAQLILALSMADRQADALATYRQLRQTLVEQLGVEPGDTVRELHRAILAGGDVLATYAQARGLPTWQRRPQPSTQPEPVAEVVVPAQLPAAIAAFAGRAEQLKVLDQASSGGDEALRVVVISGMAGVGKTALAVHWAHRVRERFDQGQLYVNLRGYAPPPPMHPVEALAGFLRTLGVPVGRMPVELEPAAALYRSLLADRRVLVVLDNAYSIEQVRPLLPGGAGCLVVITSRERLGGLVALQGAVHVRLNELDPGEAQELLARVLSRRRVQAEPEATAQLAGLCGGLPLALRMVAANLTVHPQLSIAEQVATLASGDRLAELGVDQGEQSAVRAAFDHSYAALPPESRRLFRLLGLLPGPHVTADAAASLTGTTPKVAARLLDRLASANLLDQPAPGRYALHDLVRLYAADRTHEQDTAQERRAAAGRLFDWYLRTADAAGALLYPTATRLPLPDLAGPSSTTRFDDHAEALAWLETERPNLLAAVQHTAERGPYHVAYHLADALQGFYVLRPYFVEWLATAHAGLAAARAAGDQRAEAAVERSLGNVHMRQGRHAQAAEHHHRALALSERTGWVEAETAALNALGILYRYLQRRPEAMDYCRRALALNRQLGLPAGQARNLGNLGMVSGELGQLRQAADFASEAAAIFHDLGSLPGEALCLGVLGEACQLLGRLDEAEEHLTRAIALGGEAGELANRASLQRALAAVHRDSGRHGLALELAEAALVSAGEVKEPRFQADALSTLGTIHHQLGQHRQALEFHERSLRLAREMDDPLTTVVALIGVAAAQHELGSAPEAAGTVRGAIDGARAGGHRVEEGQALTVLAAIDLAAGRATEAAEHATQAIAIQQETGHRLGEARARRALGDAEAAAAQSMENVEIRRSEPKTR